jgi:hypothetical protein
MVLSSTTGSFFQAVIDDFFIAYAGSLPLISSSGNTAIITRAVKNTDSNFQPTTLLSNEIYSVANNLINGNYNKIPIPNPDINIYQSQYIVSYSTNNGIKYTIFNVYYNNISKILYYLFPLDLVSNQKNGQVQVAYIKQPDNSIYANVIFPYKYYTILNPDNTINPISFNYTVIQDKDSKNQNFTSISDDDPENCCPNCDEICFPPYFCCGNK